MTRNTISLKHPKVVRMELLRQSIVIGFCIISMNLMQIARSFYGIDTDVYEKGALEVPLLVFVIIVLIMQALEPIGYVYKYITAIRAQRDYNVHPLRNGWNEDGNAEENNGTIDDDGNAMEVNEKSTPLNFNHLIEHDMEGRSVGKLFVSSKEIAKGSNGTVVYEGFYEGREVAVKRLVKAHLEVASKEIQNLIISDQHQHIVRWFVTEYDRDFVYIALERCDCTLHDLIKNSESSQLLTQNGYPSAFLLKLMRDIVVGLVHLHELKIIHRDLKPHNVLITKGKNICPKLSDMGISRLLVGDASSLGPNATVSGTLGWRAPEQIHHGRQTRAMDLFSLGCVLFFCITRGRHPFGDIDRDRDSNVTKNRIVNLSLVKHIPEVVNLLSRLLKPNPELRPEASEILCDPLFWNSETRMSFLRDASDRVELENKNTGSIVLRALKKKCSVAFPGTWDVGMDPAFLSHMIQYRKYDYRKVQDLLRLIRNTVSHYGDLPTSIQNLLGAMPEGPDDHFRIRFPKLLMKVYTVMYKHCKQEEWFRKYLET